MALGVLLLSSRLLIRPQAASIHNCTWQAKNCRVTRHIARSCSTSTATPGCGIKLPALLDMSSPQQQPALSLADTLQVVRIPPTGINVGPRVEHIEVTSDGKLSDAVATALALPHWFVMELIRFGAVHYSPIMPPPAEAARPRMSQQHIHHIEQLRALGRERHGRNPKLQHPKRMLGDDVVTAGGYVRVHVHPKRFPAAHSVDWRSRIVADAPEYVVVDKPAGVQVPPTVDNLLESVVCCAAVALGLPHDSLRNTHRLDAGTSGVVVLGKNPDFAAWFNALLRDKPDNVVKLYRCLTASPPPLGAMVHVATMHARAKGEPAHTRMRRPTAAADSGGDGDGDGDGAQSEGARCELIVLQVDQVSLTGSAAADWGPTAYESTLQLVTGRTHQIRAQMAAEGCPLLGDQLYTALAQRWQQQEQQVLVNQQQEDGQQQLQQDQDLQKLQQPVEQQQQCEQVPAKHSVHKGAAWSRVYQEDPLRPIGLQAYALKVRDVGGRMSRASIEEQDQPPDPQQQQQQQKGESDGHHQAGSNSFCTGTLSDDALQWVEFCTGLPWWRA